MRDLADELRQALGDDVAVEVLDTGTGYERVNLSWPDGGRAKLDVHADVVDWKHLSVGDPSEPRGRYTALCGVLPALFAARGVQRMVMAPRDAEARRRLTARGAWRGAGERMEWRL